MILSKFIIKLSDVLYMAVLVLFVHYTSVCFYIIKLIDIYFLIQNTSDDLYSFNNISL
jgi:hypothetical protein